MRYIRPISAGTGLVLAEGRLVHAGRRVAPAEGRLLVEHDRRLIAHGSTAGLILG